MLPATICADVDVCHSIYDMCLQVVFNTFWLLPLRLVLFVIPSFCLGVCLCILSILGDSLDEKNPRPLRGWRRSETLCLLNCLPTLWFC